MQIDQDDVDLGAVPHSAQVTAKSLSGTEVTADASISVDLPHTTSMSVGEELCRVSSHDLCPLVNHSTSFLVRVKSTSQREAKPC